ncbi:MAG: hypothetical protein DHS20C07_31440 [Methyloligella sp.]|nr:MAG: hypothetical protein DHS20C07_31440 [Methyloligella sp.]
MGTWERQTISQRTKEGLAAARKRGKTLSPPLKLEGTDILDARQLLESDPLKPSPALPQNSVLAPVPLRVLSTACEKSP